MFRGRSVSFVVKVLFYCHSFYGLREKKLAGRALIAIVRFGRQQELNTEVAEEVRLVAARRFQASSSHEQKDYWAVDLVARAKVDDGLGFGRMECALG